MPRAIQIAAFGGPDVMQLVDLPVGEPGPGEVRIRHHAVGLNFIDVYQRTGLYPNALPLTLGMEAAGVVESVGAGVTHLQAGDRVAYASQPPGSYCEVRVMPAKCVVQLPDGIDVETGAAMMLKGMTAAYLLRRTQPQGGLQPGDFVLFHAAAGGVGLIACQWARAMGLNLIATAGSEVLAAVVDGVGGAVLQREQALVRAARVREITEGRGVKVVYDSIGKDTFEGSLDCLAPFGLLATYGNASGPIPPVNLGVLGAKGSLYVTRPTLFTHIATREGTQALAEELFAMVSSGAVTIPIAQRYPLEQVAQAHRDLESRATTGCTILTL